MHNSPILIVGGAGYIGSHMLKMLRAHGLPVCVLDNLSSGRRKALGDVRFFQADLNNAEQIHALMGQIRPSAVMHFAALIEVGESVRDPQRFYANNLTGTLNLLAAMRAYGVSQFIFSSTAAIFGDPQYVPIDEQHPCAPINPYGRTKWMVEQILADYGVAYGLRSVCLRYFNAAGADPDAELGECHEPESHLIPLVLQVAMGRRPHIAVYGTDYPTADGSCVRDYVHVQDLCSAHLLALNYLTRGGASAQFNLGNGLGFSVLEVIERCRAISGMAIDARLEARRAGDSASLVADATLAREQLGWRPEFAALDQIIAHAWAWQQRYPW